MEFATESGEKLVWPLTVSPREVQLRALQKGFGKPGFAYFMRQRTGKTWTAYAEFTLLKEQGKVDWFVLICPNSLKAQWQSAIQEVDFLTSTFVYGSNAKGRFEKTFVHRKTPPKQGVFIINYESLKSFMEEYGTSFFPKDRTYIVADESTKIKEHTNKSTKKAIEFSDGCAYRRILTGRPTANTNLDIWAQLRFIGGTYRNFFQHQHTFVVMGGYQGRQVKKNINLELLRNEIEPISYIAEDKYIVGFEKVYEPMRKVSLGPTLRSLYEQMENELVFGLNGDINITAPIALVKYLRLQQISSGVAGDPDGVQHNLVDPIHNPRINAVLDIVENEINNKVIIVCRFKLSIQNLKERLSRLYKVGVLVGGMHSDEIEKVKHEFNEGDTKILIAQSQVLSYGHTLCATDENPCDSVIFYETDFSLLNRTQCESRPEKMGRDKPISYYDLYASKMDKYLLESLIKKEEASLALMNYARKFGTRPKGLDESEEEESDDYSTAMAS